MRYWVNLEISLGNLEFASECLIKPYILKSNYLLQTQPKVDEPSKETDSIQKPWLRGQASRNFGAKVDSDKLPLSRSQYYELLEMLVFQVQLPWKGMASALSLVQVDLPMASHIKTQFVRRLTLIRN